MAGAVAATSPPADVMRRAVECDPCRELVLPLQANASVVEDRVGVALEAAVVRAGVLANNNRLHRLLLAAGRDKRGLARALRHAAGRLLELHRLLLFCGARFERALNRESPPSGAAEVIGVVEVAFLELVEEGVFLRELLFVVAAQKGMWQVGAHATVRLERESFLKKPLLGQM